jgi:hypothetical protein
VTRVPRAQTFGTPFPFWVKAFALPCIPCGVLNFRDSVTNTIIAIFNDPLRKASEKYLKISDD